MQTGDSVKAVARGGLPKKKIRNRWNFWSWPAEAMELQTTADLNSRGCVVSQSKVNRCTLSTRTKMSLPFPLPFPPLPVTLASISMQFSAFLYTSPFLPHSPKQSGCGSAAAQAFTHQVIPLGYGFPRTLPLTLRALSRWAQGICSEDLHVSKRMECDSSFSTLLVFINQTSFEVRRRLAVVSLEVSS